MLDRLIDKGIGVFIAITLSFAVGFLVVLAFYNDLPWPVTVFLLNFAGLVALFVVKVVREGVIR